MRFESDIDSQHQDGIVLKSRLKMAMALEQELATYRRELSDLLKHEGKFVLIHWEEVAGVLETFADAMTVGYDKFGLEPFLVKRIQAVEQPLHFHGDIFGACRT